MKLKRGDTIVYGNETNYDIHTTKGAKREPLDENYKYYSTNKFKNFFVWLFYYLVAHPILALICLFRGTKVEGKKNLKGLKDTGFFIYANHISVIDAYLIPAYVIWRKKTMILAFTDVLSIPVARNIAKMCGYFPLGDSIVTQKKMMDAMEYYLSKKRPILIFPEAHIWPYFTKIRNFQVGVMHYPTKFDVPIVPTCTVCRKPIFKNSKPRLTCIIGKPIYPKKELNSRENKQYLHDECLKVMREMSEKYPQYEYYNYVYDPNYKHEEKE